MKLANHKERTLALTRIDLPPSAQMITIPMPRSRNVPATPRIREGESVRVGTKVAEGADWGAPPIYSSVSGRVRELAEDFIRIESDGADRMDVSMRPREQVPLEAEQLVEIIRNAGVVDLGGSGAAIHPRLAEAREHDVETVVIDGCESEPFLTADHVLMMNFPLEVLKGAELIRMACGARRAVIVTQQDKREAIELINSKNYTSKIRTVETMMLPVEYPMSAKRILAERVSGLKIMPGRSLISQGVLVENVATAFAIYEAIHLRKPLYERVITVTGPCVAEPKNLWARSGTPAVELLRACKGLLRDPDRVVFGGPMTGRTIPNFDVPITMEVPGIIAMPPDLVAFGKEEPCIRCGDCVDACPELLRPESLVRAVRSGNEELARTLEVDACTECGACSYVCPSKIPILSVIREGKEEPLKHLDFTPMLSKATKYDGSALQVKV
jgi:Na+-translocating ferredoxin:NAD+ oxidoreductase subunit C